MNREKLLAWVDENFDFDEPCRAVPQIQEAIWQSFERGRQAERDSQASFGVGATYAAALSRIAELERQLAEASAPAVEQQPVAYMFDVQVKRLGQRRQFAAIDYNLDSDETLVSKTALYTAPQAAEADKVRDALPNGWYEVLNRLHDNTETFGPYSKETARVAIECCMNALEDLEAENAANMAGQAPVREVPETESGDRICKESDGCPTEKAVLQRFWREHQSKLKLIK